jgi:hypothetical protein
MSTLGHTRQAHSLTRSGFRLENLIACPPATKTHRASLEPTHGGLFQGLVPTHSAIAPDLAGLPGDSGFSGPCTPSHAGACRFQAGLPRRVHELNLWGPGMAKAKTNGKAATSLVGDAGEPRPGAAQPPLDLSQGHIGTIKGQSEAAVEVAQFDGFRLVFDLRRGTGVIETDPAAFPSRQARRAAQREFLKTASRAAEGLNIEVGCSAKRRQP